MYQSRRKNLGLVTMVIILAVFLMTAMGATHSWAGSEKKNNIECIEPNPPTLEQFPIRDMMLSGQINLILPDPELITTMGEESPTGEDCMEDYETLKKGQFKAIYQESAEMECELQVRRELARDQFLVSSGNTLEDLENIVDDYSQFMKMVEQALQRNVIPFSLAHEIYCEADDLRTHVFETIPAP